MPPAIVVDDVSKTFRLYQDRNQSLKATLANGRRARFQELQALDHVSLTVEQGTTYGLIGHNGSGKSTLLKCMARILQPEHGKITVTGKVSALLELGAGFHPELSGRDNVYLNAAILGLSSKQVSKRFDDIVEFAGLERFIDTPVKNYSSGMYVRLGFSVAINVDPEVLLIDEVLAVGDAEFQRRCNEKIAELRGQGRTIVVVSHGLGALRNICDEIAWLDHGKLRSAGDASDVIDEYIGAVQPDRRASSSTETRWGSGEVLVDEVELLDGRDRPTTRLHTGEPLRLRLVYDAVATVEQPVFGVSISSLDGVLVTSPTSRQLGLDLEKADGRGTVDLEIDRLMLLPGTYDVSVSIHDHSLSHPYDVRQKVLRFDVDPGHPHEEDGLVSLGGRYTTTTLGPSQRSLTPSADAAVEDAPPMPEAAPADGFVDVPPDHPAHADIMWLVERGVTTGFADGDFQPGTAVSRQAIAAFLYRFAGSPYGRTPGASRAVFRDVPVGAPFAGEISWLVEQDIASGFGDGSFRPGALVTRQALAAFLYRYAGRPDGDEPPCTEAPFPDIAVGAPFCGEIAWLAARLPDTFDRTAPFEPGQPVTRAALATFLRSMADIIRP